MKLVNNIKEAVPFVIGALLGEDLVLVNALLDKFPRLLELKDKSNRNILMMAAYSSKPNIMSYLIAFHVIANPNLDPEAVDDEELTAYDWAVLGGNEFARSLITKVVDCPEDGNF